MNTPGRSSSSKFIQDNEWVWVDVIEDVGGLLHLQGEGWGIALNVVRGAHTRENGVTNAELSLKQKKMQNFKKITELS